MIIKKHASLWIHLVAWPALFLLFSCHIHIDAPIDNCHPFLGVYRAVETFYNPSTRTHQRVEYDIEVIKSGTHGLAFLPRNTAGFYGTPCKIEGDVFRTREVKFPINICSPDPYNTYKISGIGTLSSDGRHIHIDFYISYCTNGSCVTEPEVFVDAYRM